MAVFNVTDAVSYLGKTVLVHLGSYDPDCGLFELSCCLQIVGVVLALEGVYEHSHFLAFDVGHPDKYPTEVFWDDIKSIQVLQAFKSKGKSVRT